MKEKATKMIISLLVICFMLVNYLKVPQPDFSSKVIYNNSESKSYSSVSLFDRYSFGGWDPIESIPERGVLYIITPSQYDGLKYKSSFEIKRMIDYPNEAKAFYIVSASEQ